MNRARTRTPTLLLAAALAVAACAGPRRAAEPAPENPPAPPPAVPEAPPAQPTPVPPPPPAETPSADRTLPQRGPPPELSVPPQKHFKLSNGLAVRLVEYRRLPIVALHLVLDAGATHDPAARPGLASFTAAMLTEGTKRRSATDISDALGELGASLGAGASMDSASLSASGLVKHLDRLLELYADVLLHPTFPAADFARVQDTRLVALVQQRDQPGAVASKAFAGLYWGDHPYGHWIMGTEESVKATRRADLAKFHATWWKPQGAELVVVGDVSEADLRARLEKALGRWQGAPPKAKASRAPRAPDPRTVVMEKKGAPQAYLLLGMPGLERSSPDYVPAQVAMHVLGGGSASRLFRNLREEKGYTYGVYAMGDARRQGGVSLLAGSVKADVTGASLTELFREVERLRAEPVPAEELERSKNALVLGLPADFSTAAGIAAKLAEEVVYGLPDDYWNQYGERVKAVTAEELQAVARRVLDPARLTLVMVADPAVVQPQLSGLPVGAVQVRAAPARDAAVGRAGPAPR